MNIQRSTTNKHVTGIFVAGCPIDLVFVVDSSGSIEDDDKNNFNLVKKFLIEFINRIDLSQVRVAMLSFGGQTFIQFYLDNNRFRADQFYNDINSLPYDGGETNTDDALVKVRDDILTSTRGDRSSVNDLIILITDGKPTPRFNTQLTSTVQSIKSRGVRILGVGVTSRIDVNTMRSIVSSPSDSFYFQIDEFNNLIDHIDRVTENVCLQPTAEPVRM